MSLVGKKFGKNTYELWTIVRNLSNAKWEVKELKDAGYARARYTIRPGTRESNSTFRYFIWVDLNSKKRK